MVRGGRKGPSVCRAAGSHQDRPTEGCQRQNAGTKAAVRDLEGKNAWLQRVREEETAGAHEEAKKRAAEATGAAMEEPKKKIKRETPRGGSRVNTPPMLFQGDSASRMKTDLDAEASRSSEGSSRALRHRRKGKGKTSKGTGGPPRGTPTTSTPSSPAAGTMDDSAGVAESPWSEGWEWREPAMEEATASLLVRMQRVYHHRTAAGKALRVSPAQISIPMGNHGL